MAETQVASMIDARRVFRFFPERIFLFRPSQSIKTPKASREKWWLSYLSTNVVFTYPFKTVRNARPLARLKSSCGMDWSCIMPLSRDDVDTVTTTATNTGRAVGMVNGKQQLLGEVKRESVPRDVCIVVARMKKAAAYVCI